MVTINTNHSDGIILFPVSRMATTSDVLRSNAVLCYFVISGLISGAIEYRNDVSHTHEDQQFGHEIIFHFGN